MGGVMALTIVLVIAISVVIMDYQLGHDDDNYRCYCRMEHQNKAGNYECRGYDKGCRRCPYRKNYNRRFKNDKSRADRP